jgi:hypothetical protein
MSEEAVRGEGCSPARAGQAARRLIRRGRQVTRRKFPAVVRCVPEPSAPQERVNRFGTVGLDIESAVRLPQVVLSFRMVGDT